MAQSRLERVGTIYSRTTALVKAGAMKEENKPFWLDIYKTFPPKYEPRYDRPAPNLVLKKIFYPEDKIRARFHREHKNFSLVNMLDSQAVTRTEKFLVIYKQLETKGTPDEELYNKALEEFLATFKIEQAQREEASATRASQRSKRGIRVGKVLTSQKDDVQQAETSEILKKYKPIKLSLEKMLKDDEESVKKPE